MDLFPHIEGGEGEGSLEPRLSLSRSFGKPGFEAREEGGGGVV